MYLLSLHYPVREYLHVIVIGHQVHRKGIHPLTAQVTGSNNHQMCAGTVYSVMDSTLSAVCR